jgi:hypothetical protein
VSGQIKTEHLERQITLDIGALNTYSPLPIEEQKSTRVEVISDQTFSGGCLGNLVRTYRLSREGQEATFEQYITLTDKEAPKFTWVPENFIMTAGSEKPAVQNPTYTDNSGRELHTEFEEQSKDDAIYRIWTVADLCGNFVQHIQIISFESQ